MNISALHTLSDTTIYVSLVCVIKCCLAYSQESLDFLLNSHLFRIVIFVLVLKADLLQLVPCLLETCQYVQYRVALENVYQDA